jgi:hypothetical protein
MDSCDRFTTAAQKAEKLARYERQLATATNNPNVEISSIQEEIKQAHQQVEEDTLAKMLMTQARKITEQRKQRRLYLRKDTILGTVQFALSQLQKVKDIRECVEVDELFQSDPSIERDWIMLRTAIKQGKKEEILHALVKVLNLCLLELEYSSEIPKVQNYHIPIAPEDESVIH